MGFLSKLFKREPMPEAEAPSDAHATPADAIAHLLAHHRAMPGTWITLNAESPVGTETVIQLAEDQINLLQTELDLPGFLNTLGLTTLAEHTRDMRLDRTLWRVEGATIEELTAIVDTLFETQFGLGRGYKLVGWLER